MQPIQLLQSADSEQLTIVANAEERHGLREKRGDIECTDVFGRTVRKRQVRFKQTADIG